MEVWATEALTFRVVDNSLHLLSHQKFIMENTLRKNWPQMCFLIIWWLFSLGKNKGSVWKWLWKEEAAKGSVFTPMIHIIYISHHILIHPSILCCISGLQRVAVANSYVHWMHLSVPLKFLYVASKYEVREVSGATAAAIPSEDSL